MLSPSVALLLALLDPYDGNHPALASPGDLDGDGIGDLVVAGRREHAGNVWAVSSATGDVLYRIAGEPGDRLGRCLDGLGDVDGDGRADFVVGAYGGTRGYALAVSGRDGKTLHRVTSGLEGDGFGSAVGGGGDLDGDGVPDFLVGATGETDMPARAYSGRDGKPLFVLRPGGTFDRTHLGEAGGDERPGREAPSRPAPGLRGMSVDILADLDGDGRPEVVVGRTVDQEDGVVEVVSVGTRRLLRRHTGEVTGPDDRTHHHAIGWRVGPCGDVDADGVEDYYVSAADQAVTVQSGKSGVALHAIDYCGAWLAGEGTSVAGVGDLNGDGHADFVVGANESWDEFYDAEDAVVRAGRSGLVLHRIASRGAGIDVCGIGDVNGNGAPDLACFLERRAEVRILDGETDALLLKRRLGRE